MCVCVCVCVCRAFVHENNLSLASTRPSEAMYVPLQSSVWRSLCVCVCVSGVCTATSLPIEPVCRGLSLGPCHPGGVRSLAQVASYFGQLVTIASHRSEGMAMCRQLSPRGCSRRT